MSAVNKREPIFLGVVDFVLLAFSLFITLVVRSGRVPTPEFISLHILPFTIVFLYSIVAFYISGLYGRTVNVARASIPGTVIKTQIANGLIAVLLFYFAPIFNVTPKLSLFIYLFISSVLVITWRIYSYPLLSLQKKYLTLVIGSKDEARELIHEMTYNPRSSLTCSEYVDPRNPEDLQKIGNFSIQFRYIVADMEDPDVRNLLPKLYEKFFPQARIIDIHEFYEHLFDRIPLSCMNYAWIMSHVSSISPKIYDAGKRVTDIVLGLIVGAAACIAYPFVAFAIWLDDKGPVFITQERIGRNNKPIYIYKFRTMQRSDRGIWLKESENKVTRIGKFLRQTRIDELPQALAILRGDMSLIGPRADIVDLGKRLEGEIPYYSVRTVITPGLSGWAQVNQEKPPQSVEETKLRLSYDLFYIKNRSLALDLQIALRTLKTLLSRVGM